MFVKILARDGNCCSIQKATSKTWTRRVRYKACSILWEMSGPLSSPRRCPCTLGTEVPWNPGSAQGDQAACTVPPPPLAAEPEWSRPGLRSSPAPFCALWEGCRALSPGLAPELGRAASPWLRARPARRRGPAGQRGAQIPDTINLMSHPQQHRGAGHHLPGEQHFHASSTAF